MRRYGHLRRKKERTGQGGERLYMYTIMIYTIMELNLT